MMSATTQILFPGEKRERDREREREKRERERERESVSVCIWSEMSHPVFLHSKDQLTSTHLT